MRRRKGLLLILVLCLSQPLWSQMRYYRGNVHTHTTNSDGELSPMNAVMKYKNLGYDFCAITDHNKIIDTSPFERMADFMVIGGEEYTAYFHVNALDLKILIEPSGGHGDGINAIYKASALPILNHPTWPPRVPANFIVQQTNLRHMEIHNGLVQDQDGFDNQFLWDQVLSAGKKIWGVASDDAHRITDYGRAWIMVNAHSRDRDVILSAIRRGQYYCSTGVFLDEISLKPGEIKITSRNGQFIRFIGQNRTVLDSVFSNRAVYRYKGNENYVRVEISNRNGQMAWTQPLIFNDWTQPCVLAVSGDNQFQFAQKNLEKPLRVQIRDLLDRPLSGKKVYFMVIKGNLRLNNSTFLEVVSDANGYVQVTPTMGTTPGERQNIVLTSVDGAINPIEFSSTLLVDNVLHLVTYTGDLQTGRANAWLEHPLVARLLDQTGKPIGQQTVQFSSSDGIRFSNGQNTISVMTDGEGYASAAARLGQKSGTTLVNITLAGNSQINSRFTLTTAATSPYAIQPVSGDGQITYQELFLEPFTVAVTDTFGNPVAYQPVVYSLREGVGVFASNLTTVLTNLQGQASVRYNIKSSAAVHRIEAASKLDAKPLQFSPVTFTAYYKMAGADSLLMLSGADQTGVIKQPLATPMQIQVKDDQRKPVGGHRVIFKSLSKGAKIAGQDSIVAYTDSQGQYKATVTLGEAVGLHSHLFEIRAYRKDNKTPLHGSPVRIRASARRSTATQIKTLSLLKWTGSAGALLSDSLRVLVTDAADKPVAGQPVLFKLDPGRGVVNGKTDSVVVLTSSLGKAAVQVRIGQKVGTISLAARSDDGIAPLISSPLLFTISAGAGAPAHVQALGTDQSTMVNRWLPQAVGVKMTDSNGNPVADLTVRFTTAPQHGYVSESIVKTDSAGLALVRWRLGPALGGQKLELELEGWTSTVTIVATAAPAEAARLVKIRGDLQVVERSTLLPDSLVVAVQDSAGNPVAGQTVRFRSDGRGDIPGPDNAKSNAAGLAGVQARSGLVVGPGTVWAYLGRIDSVQFSYSVFSQTTLTRSAASTIPALSRPGAILPVRFQIKDSAEKPLANEPILYRISAGDGRIVESGPLQSNGQGFVELHWLVGTIGLQQLRTWVARDTLSDLKWQTTVYNTPPRFKMPDSLFMFSNQPYQCPIKVEDADKDSIALTAQGLPPGARLDSVSKTLYWRPRITQEKTWPVLITATDAYAAHDTLMLYLCVRKGQMPDIAAITLLGDKQEAMHCAWLPDLVGIKVIDSEQLPLEGVQVHFAPLDQDGEVTHALVTTDSSGTATTAWRLGVAIGEQKLSVQPLGWSTPLEITATSLPAPIGSFVAVSGQRQNGFRNTVLQDSLAVAVIDTCGHAMPGQMVLFTLESGGEILGRNPAPTDERGLAFVRIKTGKIPGTFQVRAEIKDDDSFSLPFEFLVQARANLIKKNPPLPGRLRPGSELVLQMLLCDGDDQPLPDQLARYSILEGYGQVKEQNPLRSDGDGLLSLSWILGAAGAQTLRTWAENDTLSEIIWHTTASTSSSRFALPDTLQLRVGDAYHWPIKLEDIGPDQATITAEHLPQGATLDSSGRVLSWQPRPDQEKIWRVLLMAVDEFGATDSLALYLNVVKINRPPVVSSRTPNDSLVYAGSPNRIDFFVEADDPDLDSLSYCWYWNGREIEHKPSLSIYFNSTFPLENAIKLVLSDGEATVESQWRIVLGATRVQAHSSAEAVPEQWALEQNYPNPFNSETGIAFAVPHADRVTLKIYDIHGSEVATLMQEVPVAAGRYQVRWNPTKLASGTYLCVLQTPSSRLLRKMVLLR